jgi:hypothetical protein
VDFVEWDSMVGIAGSIWVVCDVLETVFSVDGKGYVGEDLGCLGEDDGSEATIGMVNGIGGWGVFTGEEVVGEVNFVNVFGFLFCSARCLKASGCALKIKTLSHFFVIE